MKTVSTAVLLALLAAAAPAMGQGTSGSSSTPERSMRSGMGADSPAATGTGTSSPGGAVIGTTTNGGAPTSGAGTGTGASGAGAPGASRATGPTDVSGTSGTAGSMSGATGAGSAAGGATGSGASGGNSAAGSSGPATGTMTEEEWRQRNGQAAPSDAGSMRGGTGAVTGASRLPEPTGTSDSRMGTGPDGQR